MGAWIRAVLPAPPLLQLAVVQALDDCARVHIRAAAALHGLQLRVLLQRGLGSEEGANRIGHFPGKSMDKHMVMTPRDAHTHTERHKEGWKKQASPTWGDAPCTLARGARMAPPRY